MQNFLESNLHLLHEYDAPLSDLLRSHIPSTAVEVFQTPQNMFSLRIRQGGKTVLLHSGQNPIREAQRWCETLEIPHRYNIMVLGCGLLYHVYEIVKRYHEHLQNVVVVEKDIDVLHAVFSSVDLSRFLITKKTFFVVNPSPAEMRSFMNRHITPFTLDGLSLVEHPLSVERFPDFYKEIQSIVHESLQGGEILLRTKVQLGGLIQDNMIRNSPHVYRSPNVSAFQGMLPEVPAFVVGAGPSLNRNIDALAEVGEQGVIIAVDTVFKLLREKGIQPHIVVSTDPTEWNVKHFEGINELGESILVFSYSVNPRIPDQLKGTQVTIPAVSSRLLQLFSPIKMITNPMSTGVNVGQTCFNLARYLGCNPIALVGLDLSFPVEGGETHAQGTALQRRIFTTNSPQKMKVELLDEQRSLEEFEPIYIPGNTVDHVATNQFWLAYLRSLEQEIQKTEARVVNCTEGGARIQGAEISPLKDFIHAHCTKDAQVRGNLQAVVGFFFGEPMTEGIEILSEGKEILDKAIEYAQQGLSEISALKTVANSRSPDPALLKEKLDAIYACHKNLVQDHKVYVILDEAADAVLQPFLQQESRPSGEPTSRDNIQKAIDRYHPYFEGMKHLCQHYSTLIQETLDTMQSSEDTTPEFSF